MTAVTFSDTQLDKILVAINASHNDWWWQWVPVVSVFVSALLAMLVGIAIETYKTSARIKRENTDRDKAQIGRINTAISVIGYNIDILTRIATQHLLPHHTDSNAAYAALEEAQTDPTKLALLAMSISSYKYPALVTTCPEIHFVEIELFKDFPFVVEQDPELLIQTGWIISHGRELNAAINKSNDTIIRANQMTTIQGGLKYAQIRSAVHFQKSTADAECLIAIQLFEIMLDVAKRLEKINSTYTTKGRRAKMTASTQLEVVMKELHEIRAKSTESQPTITPAA